MKIVSLFSSYLSEMFHIFLFYFYLADLVIYFLSICLSPTARHH